MNIRFTGKGFQRACCLLLVGTIAGGVSYGKVHLADNENVMSYNDFFKGYYYDEDVKKNKEDLYAQINGSKEKVYKKK